MDHYEALFIGTLITCSLLIGVFMLAAGYAIAKSLSALAEAVSDGVMLEAAKEVELR